MNARLIRTRARGQSIPLIALMIVVLFGMVGLAVDVGNTYAEQRSTIRASNAAALVGMNTLISGGNDSTIYSAIVKSLESNGIRVAAPGAQPQPGERVLEANYLDASGNPLASCPTVGSCGTLKPTGAAYLRVNVGGRVDTFFARLVGQDTLPVNANAFSSRGPCATGVYPIVVRDSYLNENGFVQPDSRYSDNIYKNKTMKRVFLKDNATPNGGFSYVRWKADPRYGNSPELRNMLAGDGNLDEGFQEAPWPNSSEVSLPKPDVYPYKPGQLQPGDWVYGNSGLSNGGSSDELNWHIKNRTVLTLPIFDADNGRDGINGNYHISRLGAFLILGYGFQTQRDANGMKGWYFDMVYIGNASDCAVLVTNAPPTTNLGITGQVAFRPRAREIPQSRPPVAFTIVMDVSGSMSWTFDGKGWRNGRAIQCTGTTNNCSGNDAWPVVSERRIYIAKQALKGFIDQMGPNDIMRIVSYSGDISSPDPNRAIRDLTDTYPTNGGINNSGWTSDKNALKSAVDKAGAVNNDPYRTSGLTPSAVGLAAGHQALDSAPPTSPATGEAYRKVVIFMTDGVANVFRDGTYNNGGKNCGSEVASCHVGYTNSNPPVPKPITAMALEATSLKQKATIYTIALADVDQTGLPDTASAPNFPFFSHARVGSDLSGIFASISTDVKSGPCQPAKVVGDGWQYTIAQENAAELSGLTYPIVGYVFLYDQSGNPLPNGKNKAPIQVDAQSGNLIYQFSDLAPGTYQMEAYVGYKGADGISRVYQLIFNPNTQTSDTRITFNIDPSETLGRVVAMPLLQLDMSGSVCPTNP